MSDDKPLNWLDGIDGPPPSVMKGGEGLNYVDVPPFGPDVALCWDLPVHPLCRARRRRALRLARRIRRAKHGWRT